MKNIKSIIFTELKDTIPEISINDFHASDYADLNDDMFSEWNISENSLAEEYENPDTGETYYKHENESEVLIEQLNDIECVIKLHLYLTNGIINNIRTTLTVEAIILEDNTHVTLEEILNDTENNEYTPMITCEYLKEDDKFEECCRIGCWEMEVKDNKCLTCDKDNKTCGYFSLEHEAYKRCRSKLYNIVIDRDTRFLINKQPTNN